MVYLCYRLVQPFVPALSWGLALAVVGYPVHRFVGRHVRHATLAASLTVLVIALVVIAPVVFVTQQLVRQVMGGATAVRQALEDDEWRGVIEGQPQLAALLEWIESVGSVGEMMSRLGEYLGEWGPSVAVGSLAAAVQLFINSGSSAPPGSCSAPSRYR